MLKKALLTWVALSLFVAMGGAFSRADQAGPAPVPSPTPKPEEKNRVRVVKEYYTEQTQRIRNACIEAIEAEVLLQTAAILSDRGIGVKASKVEWLGTDGVVQDDNQGVERFSYRLLLDGVSAGAPLELFMDYTVHSQIWTARSPEEPGDPGAGRRILKNFWVELPIINRLSPQVREKATGRVVANLLDPISGEPVDYFGAPLRLSALECHDSVVVGLVR